MKSLAYRLLTRQSKNSEGLNLERLIFARGRYWTALEWEAALWAGESRQRALYLSRDYRWATRQARIGEFEAAWSQRTRQSRTAFLATLKAANDNEPNLNITITEAA